MSKNTVVVKKCGLIGAGIGIALFAVFGLMQGALIGGTAGMAIANYIFGSGTLAIMADELLPRIVLAASMLAGVAASCIAFVVAGSVAGAAGGYLLSLLVSVPEGAKDGYAVAEASASEKD